jgi:hypothetical protein
LLRLQALLPLPLLLAVLLLLSAAWWLAAPAEMMAEEPDSPAWRGVLLPLLLLLLRLTLLQLV